jgi:excisionase family DNA binding protein
MNELLTTRELQELLKVDRITIYRMLGQGRLQGFKVGGQWRFSRKEIEGWLDAQRDLLPLFSEDSQKASAEPSAATLPLHCMKAMQDIFAEAVDVAALTVSLGGEPLTPVSRSCEFCELVQSTERGRQRCAGSWRQSSAPRAPGDVLVYTCHAGLSYASGLVVVAGQTVAMILGGQVLFSSPEGEDWEKQCRAVADVCGIPAENLLAASRSIRVHDPKDAARLKHLLGLLATTFSSIGEERLALLGRLRRIAEISSIVGDSSQVNP